MCIILIEESTKYERKYTCPFCNFRSTKKDLVRHIEDEHEELIPQDFTAARLVFNIANKKDYGACTICKKPAPWNEETWRYERFCCEKCRDKYRKIVDARNQKKYGVRKLTSSIEHQKKMLNGRSISGEYKFQDGGIRTYVGSYEKNLLEILDTFYNAKSEDIDSPGPVIEYTYKGETHKWITDQYYAPYNLVFDVKDGGSNKNTHPSMKEYREKQIAKEKAIKKQGKYNYIRLTDNDFSQLFSIMNELKYNMNNGISSPVVHINEETLFDNLESAVIGEAVYMVLYSQNTLTTEGVCFSKDITLENMFMVDPMDLKIKPIDKQSLNEYYYSIIEVSTDRSKEIYKQILTNIKEDTEIMDIKYFLNLINEQEGSIEEHILRNEEFSMIESGFDLSKYDIMSVIKETKKLSDDMVAIPVIESSLKESANKVLNEHANLSIYNSPKGFFVCNESNKSISGTFDNIEDIDKKTLNIVSRGY